MKEALVQIYWWVLGLFGKRPHPKKVTNVSVEINMAKNAHITWTDPTSLASGRPLDLEGIEVSLSADLGANFTAVPNLVVPGQQFFDYFDLGDAEYIVRLVAVATDGRRSPPVDTNFVIDNSAPEPVTNVAVTLS